jgi:hypothetical protein
MKNDAQIRKLLLFSASVVILSLIVGCAPTISIKEPPIVTGPSATITIVRNMRSSFSGPSTLYIELDGRTIAGLSAGQYTKFSVPEGNHSIAVTWSTKRECEVCTVLAIPIAIPILLKGVNIFGPEDIQDFKRQLGIRFESSKNYFFTLSTENEGVEFNQVDTLQDDFVLKGKTYVPPGSAQPK